MYPDEGLASADAPGWLAKRTIDILKTPALETMREHLPRWRDALHTMIARLRVHNNLVWNDENETWMDTAWNDDGRAGARIEIQALAISMCDAHALLAEEVARS